MYDGINSSSESDNSMRIGSGHFLSFNIDRYLNNKENFDISKIKQLLPMIEVSNKKREINWFYTSSSEPALVTSNQQTSQTLSNVL